MPVRRRRRLAAAALFLTAATGLSWGTAATAAAHPLGNFTVNYYTGIRAEPHAVVLDLVVDRAEIPTLQAFPDAAVGRQPIGAITWQARECATLASQAQLSVADRPQFLTITSTRLEMLPGAAGLATSRLECTARTPAVDTVGHAVTYRAAPTAGRVGWHEVTAQCDGVTLGDATVPAISPSKQLTAYPQDLLASPLDVHSAQFTIHPGTGRPAQSKASGLLSSSPIYGLDRLTTAYTDLVSRTTLTPGFALLALALSLVLGALHAFAPGHGKTLMAAYLVGREGTWRQAAVIGVSVTVTHTIGVLLLGVALSAAALAAPEQVYPWLGLISGVLLAGIGVTLLRSARGGHHHGPGGHNHGPSGHDHGSGDHTEHSAPIKHSAPVTRHEVLTASEHGSPLLPVPAMGSLRLGDHTHDLTHDHSHDHSHQAAPPPQRHGRRGLSTVRLALVGLVGGMVPSPSALLVLLGGIALGRAWFGVVLVVAYGAGMAAALVGTGLLLVAARDRLEGWNAQRAGRRAELPGQAAVLRWTRRLPIVTAATVILAGIWIAARSIAGI